MWKAVARLTPCLWLRGEVVRVVLAGVVWIRVGSETSVDDRGWGVDIYFAGLGASRRHRAFASLYADVSDGSVERRMYEFGVVFVHYFALDESSVLRLLSKGCL